MRAIRIRALGGPEVLQIEEWDCGAPGPGEVRVALRAIGVNPVETYARSGKFGKTVSLPYTPGTDGAGDIVAVGDGVTGWTAGDRVFLSGARTGTYADEVVCAAGDVHRLPTEVSYAEGAAIGIPYATAWRGVFQRGGFRAGETLLVHGASGGVGTAAVQLASAAGVRVFGTAGSEAGRDLVCRMGAEAAFNHRDGGYREAIKEATGGRGVDGILEMLANVNLGADLQLLAPRGRVVVIGSRGPVEIDPRDAMVREADIRGVMLPNASTDERQEIDDALVRGLAEGKIRPVIDRTFSLSDAAQAHRAVMEGDSAGKIVLVP